MDIWREMMYKTPLSHSTLFPMLLLSLMNQKYSPDCVENINSEYDYIVVGGGTAGSVVASRLSEDSCVNVLVLEAGPKPPLISEVPGLSYSLLRTDVDWKFETVPQRYTATGLRNKQLMWHSGKMLGGSGSFNAMNYVRGNHKNYDDWAVQGAKGWSYEDVLPYFLKLEDNRNINLLVNGYHRAGGPITFEKPRFHSKIKNALHEAVEELGYKFIDPNGARQTDGQMDNLSDCPPVYLSVYPPPASRNILEFRKGFYNYQMNMRNGQRCSSVKGYLVPADHRPNLDILLNAIVTKIIIKDKRAKAVEFYYDGKYQKVKAKKEIIVSGGAVNSPKLLMLSGIGPREELEKWKIPVVAHLPVGKNLQDHGASAYFFTVDPQFGMKKFLQDESSTVDYINYRSGPLTNFGVLVIAFLEGLNVTASTDFPNYQLYINEISKGSEKTSNLEPEVYRRYFGPINENRTFCACSSQHLQPRSRGTVTLRSPNPFDPPVIDPHYLEDPKDLDDIVDGLKMCKKIVSTKALQRLGAKPFDTLMPGCEMFANSDDDYFKCFTRRYFASIYHAVGTVKMGDPDDPSTVVDQDLRVKGINGLRVVDASVMPIVPSGNTNIPTIMVAEKASDIIRRSFKCF